MLLKKITAVTKIPVVRLIRTMHFHAHIFMSVVSVGTPMHPEEAGIHTVHIEFDFKEVLEHSYEYNERVIRRKYHFVEKILIHA